MTSYAARSPNPRRPENGPACCVSWRRPTRAPAAQSAAGWLAEALARTSDPRERAGIAHELARTYAALFRWVEAVDTTDRALAELGDRDPALAARLEAELAVAGMHDARRAARVVAVMERLRARRPSPDPETAEALAVARAMAGVLTGQLTAEAAGSLDDAMRAAEPAAANWDTRAALLWTMITAERFRRSTGPCRPWPRRPPAAAAPAG